MTMQDRARQAGIAQTTIARLIGYTDDGVSRAIRREPPERVIAAIVAAWEIMSPEQRAAWLAALGVPLDRPRRGRPRKSSRDHDGDR
jgi:hypothetical protein